MAEIAALSPEKRKEYYKSLKYYRDMNNIVAQKNEEIAQRDQKIAQKDQQIAAYQRENAELRQRLGSNSNKINHY